MHKDKEVVSNHEKHDGEGGVLKLMITSEVLEVLEWKVVGM